MYDSKVATHSGILLLDNTFLVFTSSFALENKVSVDTEVKEVNKYLTERQKMVSEFLI